ncbi:MAG: ATP synthase F1 subunit epsilon [Rubrobacter sp.]|nr:ATP synthase F1 subunit epsilon [Rubrobacter sp.]
MAEAQQTEDRQAEGRQAQGRQLFCRVITPERMIFDGEAERVIARLADGELGVLVDHAPVVSTIEIGDVRIKQGDETTVYATSDGFFKVSDNLVMILVEEALEVGEIDVDAAENRIEQAENERSEEASDQEEAAREIDRRVKVAENLVRVARKYGRG